MDKYGLFDGYGKSTKAQQDNIMGLILFRQLAKNFAFYCPKAFWPGER